MKKMLRTSGIMVFFAVWVYVFSACSAGKEHNPLSGLFPEEPDTAHIKEMINFLEENQTDSIINLPKEDSIRRPYGIFPVIQPKDDMRKKVLDGVYLPRLDARYVDFRGSVFRSAKCFDGDFSYADFRAADVRWTNFDNSAMQHCNFSQSKLFHVHVNHSDLSFSNFEGANMFGMEGHHAVLRKCNFTGALMKDVEFLKADFTGSVLVKTKLFRAVLKGAKLDSCDLSYSDFTGAGMEKASFVHSRLWNVNMQGAHLQGADFTGADLQGVNFYGANFDKTVFKDAFNLPDFVKENLDENGMLSVNTQKNQ